MRDQLHTPTGELLKTIVWAIVYIDPLLEKDYAVDMDPSFSHLKSALWWGERAESGVARRIIHLLGSINS